MGVPAKKANELAPPESPARRTLLKAGAVAAVALGSRPASAQSLRKVSIVYPTVSPASWPFWIAKQAGIYQKYGMDVDLKFGVHPAGMASVISGDAIATNYGLEQVLAASLRDPTLTMFGSSLSKGTFVLVSKGAIGAVADLRGKRIGVGRIGDTPYFYTVELLGKYGLAANQVQWISTGADSGSRAAMLANGQLDAALLTSPSHYKLIETNRFRELTSLVDHPDIPVTTVYLMKKSVLKSERPLAVGIVKANAEAIKRFYTDKPFAVATYMKYDPTDAVSAGRIYDVIVQSNALERIPIVRRSSLVAAAHRIEAELPAVKTFDFATVVDNSIVRQLAAEGWFTALFGPGVAAEQAQRLKEGV